MRQLTSLTTSSVRDALRQSPSSNTHQHRCTDESGSSLVLAMVFLVSVSLITISLLSWVGTSLTATGAFSNERNLEYATTSAVNLAIQNTRGTFNSSLLEASPPLPCWGSGSTSSLALNGYTIDVWCSMVWNPFSGSTRVVTYSACPEPIAGENLPDATTSNVTCASSPLLQAQETFDDYTSAALVSTQPVKCNLINSCGQSQDQDSWQWSPTIPTVTSVTGATAPVAGGAATNQTLTINGTGFVAGSTVNLVWETGPNPESWTYPPNASTPTPETDENGAGYIVQATVIAADTTPTQITAVAPAVTTGPYFFVTVTTPSGTSAYQPPGSQNFNVFTYSTPAPTVSSISGSGSITGGALVTVNGTNFYNESNFATQVWFWQNGVEVAASNVVVKSTGPLAGQQLTAISPAVSSTGYWYVQVVTVGGASTNTSDYFQYGVQAPIITSISPTSSDGSGSSSSNPTQLVILGANFLSGSTVWFCALTSSTLSQCELSPTGGYGQIPASASVASSGAAITVTIPASSMTAGTKYFPIVELPYPYLPPNYPPSQPYNEGSDTFTFT